VSAVKAFRRVKFVPVFLMMLSLGGLTACQGKKAPPVAQQQDTVAVQADTLRRLPMEHTIAFVGNLDAWQVVHVGAQSPGRIAKIYVQEGDTVSRGDLLVQMDNSQLTQTRIQYNLAAETYKRMQTLYQDGGTTRQQLNQVEANYKTAQSEYRAVQQNTQLRAPFSGTITSKNLNEGEVFLLAPTSRGSPSIVTLMDLQTLKLLVDVSEQDFPRVRLGQTAQLTVPVYPGDRFTGTVTNIRPVIDLASRTFQVQLQIPNDQQRLRPGMFARGRLGTGVDTVLAVPRGAVREQPGTAIRFCFVVQNGQAARQQISLGQTQGSLVEIRKGLQSGQQVILSGIDLLKDGTPVRVVPGKPAGGTGQ